MLLFIRTILKVLEEEYISNIEYRNKQQRAGLKLKGEQKALDFISKGIN